MNEASYARLEASKRLEEAGIVLETECYWSEFEDGWRIVLWPSDDTLPAPSMAEVWRELPTQGCYFTANQGYYYAWMEWTDFEGHGKSCEAKENTNPTDALIDLLIWVKCSGAGKE